MIKILAFIALSTLKTWASSIYYGSFNQPGKQVWSKDDGLVFAHQAEEKEIVLWDMPKDAEIHLKSDTEIFTVHLEHTSQTLKNLVIETTGDLFLKLENCRENFWGSNIVLKNNNENNKVTLDIRSAIEAPSSDFIFKILKKWTGPIDFYVWLQPDQEKKFNKKIPKMNQKIYKYGQRIH
jgi:hypothetical protein